MFQKNGEVDEANVEASVIFDDASGFQVGRNTATEKLCAPHLVTPSNHETHIFHFTFRLAAENYTLRVIIGDEQMRQRFSSACPIKVPSFRKSQPQISSLLLARGLEMSGQVSLLQKNGRSLFPNVPHLFTAEQPAGFLYFEVYNLAPIVSPSDSFQVYCSISPPDQEIYSASWKSPKPEASAAINLPLNLSDLEPGEYILTVRVVDLTSKREANSIAIFYFARSSPPSLGLLKVKHGQI